MKHCHGKFSEHKTDCLTLPPRKKKTQHYPASATQICILITWSKCNYTSNNAGAKPEIWSMYIKQYSVATEFKTKT